MLDHGALHRMELASAAAHASANARRDALHGDALHRDKLAAGDLGKQQQTAVHRLVARAPVAVAGDEGHGAGAAFTLGAAFLRAGEPLAP